jgi:hypothetical protein
MPNGRCRMYRGTSTGPRTAEGAERSRRAVWKHGAYSVAAKHDRINYILKFADFARLLKKKSATAITRQCFGEACVANLVRPREVYLQLVPVACAA